MSTAGLSRKLASHVAGFPETALPETAFRAAGRALLDATGVMLAASGISEEAAPFIDLAAAQPGPCTVLGTGLRSTASLAAFANGAMAHALDFEDVFDFAPCHPNAALIPAALAMAEHVGGVSPQALGTALAIGCDLTCRMALSLRQPMEAGGWYPPPILGAFGATAAAARVAGLTTDQTLAALSLALCQATAPGEIKHDPETSLRAVREAFPAEAAVRSVLLARAGVRGFEAPLEGKGGFFALYAGGQFDPADLMEGLGERFWGEQVSFKLWPACRGTHSFIALALKARARPGFDPGQIDRIVADIGEVQTMLMEPAERKRAPANAIDAKFSIPFTVALALVRGAVELDDFDAASRTGPDIARVAALVEGRPRPEWGRSHATAAALRIHFSNGETFEGELATAKGPASSPDNQELIRKYLACSARSRKAVPESVALHQAEQLLDLRITG